MRLDPIYRYVGPAELAATALGTSGGVPIRSGADLARATRDLSGTTLTYVIDGAGVLRVAARESEHVACAGGGLVFAAGELFASRDGRVEDATNLSTGYCPRPSCLEPLAAVLDAASIARPTTFETTFEMRRCERCAAGRREGRRARVP